MDILEKKIEKSVRFVCLWNITRSGGVCNGEKTVLPSTCNNFTTECGYFMKFQIHVLNILLIDLS